MENKYIIRGRISEDKFREILRLFCIDIEAIKVSKIANISRPTINTIFIAIRKLILEECNKESPLGIGEIEIDESYFGAKRVKGKRGRGASGKTPVFGMLKRNGKVYTQIVNNCSMNELIPIIQEKTSTYSSIFSDNWKAYDGLANLGYKRHYRIKHGNDEFAKTEGEYNHIRNHINGIENFWGLCKVRLTRCRGIHKHTFLLHLKECEFRYNNRDKNLYQILVKLIRKNPLKLSRALFFNTKYIFNYLTLKN